MQTPSDFFLYKDSNGEVKVGVCILNETVWLPQDKIAQLFGVGRSVVTKHLKNVYKSGELSKEITCAKIAQVQTKGTRQVTRQIEYYNLDAILSVGYRVNRIQTTYSRIWANGVLKEYLIKGVAMNDERLKNSQTLFGKNYFEEQLTCIRDIRTSERRFYQKITDIYSQCSAGYEAFSDVAKKFYALFRISRIGQFSGKRQPRLLFSRVDADEPNMGLITWKNVPNENDMQTGCFYYKERTQ